MRSAVRNAYIIRDSNTIIKKGLDSKNPMPVMYLCISRIKALDGFKKLSHKTDVRCF